MTFSVRPASPADAHEAATLIYLAGVELFRYLFHKDPDESVYLIRDFFLEDHGVFAYHNAYLAVNEKDTVAGLIYCVDEPTQSRSEVEMRSLFPKHFGMFRTLQRLPRFLRFAQFTGSVHPGEFFINHLAVFPTFRGKGIARQLLQFAEEEARRRGLVELGLYVDFDNHPARRVYESFGFDYVERIEANVKLIDSHFHGQDRMSKSLSE